MIMRRKLMSTRCSKENTFSLDLRKRGVQLVTGGEMKKYLGVESAK